MKPRTAEISELAWRAFIRTTGLFRNRMDPYFAKFGISAAQWGVLRALQRAEAQGLERLRLTDLGQRLLVKPPSVTSLIDRLERSGLVARQAAHDDQRAKLLNLTPAGRQLVARVLEGHPGQVRAIMGGLTESEQHQLHHLMERLAAHLEATDSPAPDRDQAKAP